MKITPKVLLLAASLTTALSVHAQTLLTDFSTSTGFGSSSVLLGTGSAISVSSGVANYTASSPSATSDFSYVRYEGAVGSYSSNWAVRVDTSYAAASTIFDSGYSQFVNLGLLVVQTGVTPGISGNTPTFYGFEVATNIYQNTSNSRTSDVRVSTWTPTAFTDDSSRYVQTGAGAAIDRSIRITYNASTHVLTAGYDADGATGGYSFTNISSLTMDASTWGMTGANTFSVYLMGNSGYDGGGGTQMGPGIAAGEATFDNLTGSGLTAVPEPSTYAAIAGALALGLAAWRRKSRASVAA